MANNPAQNHLGSLATNLADASDNVLALSVIFGAPQAQALQQLVNQLAPLANVPNQINALQGQMNTLQGQMNTLQGQVNGLQGQVNGLQGQVNNLQMSINVSNKNNFSRTMNDRLSNEGTIDWLQNNQGLLPQLAHLPVHRV